MNPKAPPAIARPVVPNNRPVVPNEVSGLLLALDRKPKQIPHDVRDDNAMILRSAS
ncbi:MAG: hypothetical protein ACYC42_05565 [Lysobacter sp.]